MAILRRGRRSGLGFRERLHVLYCDDQARFREAFVKRHQQNFEVEPVESIAQLRSRLRNAQLLPDVVLLDLYHPRETADFEAARNTAEQKLAELTMKIDEVRQAVDEAWSPTGLSVLEEIRRHYPPEKLPIMIYTQRGLFLLDDDQMRRVEELDADWLLKDTDRLSDRTEATRISRVLYRSRSLRRVQRDVLLTVAGAVAGIVLSTLVAHL